MNVANEKLLGKRVTSHLHEQSPNLIANKSSSKNKRACKQSRFKALTIRNNEKDFIHPPLPVRKNNRMCSHFEYKRPKVIPHRSAHPNASYLKLTKSFFGSESFTSLRSNLLNNQKDFAELNQTCLAFAPKITSTPNPAVNNHKPHEVLNCEVSEDLPQKSKSGERHSMNDKSSKDDLAVQQLAKFLSNDSKCKSDDMGKTQTLDCQLFFDETSMLEYQSNVLNVDKTTLSDSNFFNNKESRPSDKHQFSRLSNLLNPVDNIDKLMSSKDELNIFQSGKKYRLGMHDTNFFPSNSSSIRNESIAVSMHEDFPRIPGSFPINQDLTAFLRFEVNINKEQKTSSHFEDVANMTDFGERLQKLSGTLDIPDYAEVIPELPSQNQNRYTLHGMEDFTVNDLLPSSIRSVYPALYREKNFHEIHKEIPSPRIIERSGCFPNLIHDESSKEYACPQEANFDSTDVNLGSQIKHHSDSVNFELPPTDVTWEPYCRSKYSTPKRNSDDTFQEHEDFAFRTEQIIQSIEKDLRESPTFRYSPRKMF